jgi:hypothetical protein
MQATIPLKRLAPTIFESQPTLKRKRSEEDSTKYVR